MDAGLRVSEAVQLQVKHINFQKKELYIRSLKKRKKEVYRTIPMTSRILNALADYWPKLKDRTSEAYLFPAGKGSQQPHLNRKTVWKRIKKYSGKTVHPHMLRHFFGTNLSRTWCRYRYRQGTPGSCFPQYNGDLLACQTGWNKTGHRGHRWKAYTPGSHQPIALWTQTTSTTPRCTSDPYAAWAWLISISAEKRNWRNCTASAINRSIPSYWDHKASASLIYWIITTMQKLSASMICDKQDEFSEDWSWNSSTVKRRKSWKCWPASDVKTISSTK